MYILQLEITFQIATIVHSRQSRDVFDPRWMDLYEKVVLESHADKVTPLVVNPGRIVLSTSKLYFQPYNKMGEVIIFSVRAKIDFFCQLQSCFNNLVFYNPCNE